MAKSIQEEFAQQFADDLVTFHDADLHGGDEERKNAVIVKSVALVALAFGIPAVAGEPLDIDEAITKLRESLSVLGREPKGH
jgi:hypothetical protein